VSEAAVNGRVPTGSDLSTSDDEVLHGELVRPRGAEPPAVESDPIDSHIERIEDSLVSLLDPIRNERAELEVRVMELTAQEERITAAVTALNATKAKPRGRPPTRPAGATKQKAPAPETIERVFAILKTKTTPVTTRQIAEQIGLSGETVSRAINVLRDEERVRMVGTRPGKGVVPLYLAG
jgi:CRP-like cAMP-binding protein